MTSRASLMVSLLLLACGSSKSDDFVPQEGDWTAVVTAIDNTCSKDMANDMGDTDGIILALTDGGEGFSLAPDNGDTGLTEPDMFCTLDGQDYTCETAGESSQTYDWSGTGADAVTTQTDTFSGSFGSEATGTMLWQISVTCQGSDCAELADAMGASSFPCDLIETRSLTAD
jgi:hypothetical protein